MVRFRGRSTSTLGWSTSARWGALLEHVRRMHLKTVYECTFLTKAAEKQADVQFRYYLGLEAPP